MGKRKIEYENVRQRNLKYWEKNNLKSNLSIGEEPTTYINYYGVKVIEVGFEPSLEGGIQYWYQLSNFQFMFVFVIKCYLSINYLVQIFYFFKNYSGWSPVPPLSLTLFTRQVRSFNFSLHVEAIVHSPYLIPPLANNTHDNFNPKLIKIKK